MVTFSGQPLPSVAPLVCPDSAECVVWNLWTTNWGGDVSRRNDDLVPEMYSEIDRGRCGINDDGEWLTRQLIEMDQSRLGSMH